MSGTIKQEDFMAEEQKEALEEDDTAITGEDEPVKAPEPEEAVPPSEETEPSDGPADEEAGGTAEAVDEEAEEEKAPAKKPAAKKTAAKKTATKTAATKTAAKKPATKKPRKKKPTQQEAMMNMLMRLQEHVENMEKAQVEMIAHGSDTKRRETILLSDKERAQIAKEEMIAGNIKLSGVGESFKTDADRDKEEVMLLNQATKSKSRLMGVISQISAAEGTPTVKVYEDHDTLKHFPITIPVQELFPYSPDDYAGPKGRENLENELVSRIGAHIEFMLYRIDEKNKIGGASRLNAMSDRAVMNFIKVREDGKPEFVPGMKTNAKVIAVRNNKLVVEVHGVETTIRGRDMGYGTFNRMHELYQIGDEPLVLIKGITNVMVKGAAKEYPYVKLDVSIRDAQQDPAIEAFSKYRVHDVVRGRVVNASEGGGLFVSLDDKIDCMCPYPKTRDGKIIAPGDEVPVMITNMDEETRRIRGIIYAYNR